MLRTKLEYNEFLFVFPEVVGLQQVLTKADPGSHTSPRRIWRERNWEQESVCLPIMATAEWTQLTAKTAVLIWSPNGKGEDRQSKEEAKISTVSSQGTVGLDPCRKRERERENENLPVFLGTPITQHHEWQERTDPQRATPVWMTFCTWKPYQILYLAQSRSLQFFEKTSSTYDSFRQV